MRVQEILKKVIPLLCILSAAVILIANPNISADWILCYTPANPFLAAWVILLLYAVKSASVVFPMIVLEIAVGLMFPTGAALLVNFLGILVLLTVPYWIGHFSGIEAVGKMIQKYPKFGAILDRQQENSFFLCFLFRIISCLPCDVVSMYFGATGAPYWKYLAASTLGLLPGMILATLLGVSIEDPTSPMFWITVALKVLFAAVSILIYYQFPKKKMVNGDT